MMPNEDLWQATLAQIQFSVSQTNFATWFKNTRISSVENGTAVISVENNFSKAWLSNKYYSLILKILREIDNEIKNIEFFVFSEEALPFKGAQKKESIKTDQMPFQELIINQKTNLNPKYTFENFVVGRFNEMAHAAGWAISESPGTAYNPLFIYGGVGLGKTHLLQSIGNRVVELFPEKMIKYLTCERFVSGVVDAIKSHKISDFKKRIKEVDILIMDDVQFFAGKDKSQEEFYHVYNLFHQSQKQIILSSDRPPKAIPAIEERLRSRFEGGMVVDIGIPDTETKIAILKEKCAEKGMEIGQEILDYLAANIRTNIRELEGALNKVLFLKKINNKIEIEDIKKNLNSIINMPKKATNFRAIIDAIGEFYNLSEKDLFTSTRRQEIVRPRQVAMYLLREELGESYPSIGRKFGGKDHTTAIYACSKIAKESRENEDTLLEINSLKQKLYSETIKKEC